MPSGQRRAERRRGKGGAGGIACDGQAGEGSAARAAPDALGEAERLAVADPVGEAEDRAEARGDNPDRVTDTGKSETGGADQAGGEAAQGDAGDTVEEGSHQHSERKAHRRDGEHQADSRTRIAELLLEFRHEDAPGVSVPMADISR